MIEARMVMHQFCIFLQMKPIEPVAQTFYLLAREMEVFREEQFSLRVPPQELLAQQPDSGRGKTMLIALVESDDPVAVGKVFGHRSDRRLYGAGSELYVVGGIEHGVLGALRHKVATIDRTAVLTNINNPPNKAVGVIQ